MVHERKNFLQKLAYKLIMQKLKYLHSTHLSVFRVEENKDSLVTCRNASRVSLPGTRASQAL